MDCQQQQPEENQREKKNGQGRSHSQRCLRTNKQFWETWYWTPATSAVKVNHVELQQLHIVDLPDPQAWVWLTLDFKKHVFFTMNYSKIVSLTLLMFNIVNYI